MGQVVLGIPGPVAVPMRGREALCTMDQVVRRSAAPAVLLTMVLVEPATRALVVRATSSVSLDIARTSVTEGAASPALSPPSIVSIRN